MTRRAWLSLLAGAALDPERLLWVPGRRVISIPAPAKLESPTFKAYLVNRDWLLGRGGNWCVAGPVPNQPFTWHVEVKPHA